MSIAPKPLSAAAAAICERLGSTPVRLKNAFCKGCDSVGMSGLFIGEQELWHLTESDIADITKEEFFILDAEL